MSTRAHTTIISIVLRGIGVHKTAQGHHRLATKGAKAFCQQVSVTLTFLFTFLITIVGVSSIAWAQATPESIFSDSPTFLKVDEAFGFDFEQKGDQLIVEWTIADGYYLYKKQFKTATKNVVIGEPHYPAHEQIEDEFFGLSDVFFEDMEMAFPIINAQQDGSVKLRFQGCAEAGLCYPPTTKVIFLEAFDSGLLAPEQAFNASLLTSTNTEVVFNISIADTYFVRKDSIQIDSLVHEFGPPVFSASTKALTPTGTSDVFYNSASVTFPITATDTESAAPPVVELFFAGCANEDVCYQPTSLKTDINNIGANTASEVALVDNSAPVSEQFTLAEKLLSEQSIFISLGLLTLLGLGLAFTPCVYPMYPILSSIVIGKGKKEIKTSHAFALSFVFVQGMAITYSLIGLIVASAGVQFQAALQHPVLLGVFIVLFVALALAMFGLYEIQMPSKWQNKLNSLSDGQKQGNFFGVFVMGVVAGLVASPCTTAPLTAVLIVVAQSESLVFGFFSLYALSIGMGIPLILFGISGGKLLPKAGAWMNVIKVTFGFMMLTVAILFVERFIVSDWTELLWAALALGLFAYWYTVNQNTQTTFAKGVRTTISLGGLVFAIIFTIQSLQKVDLIPTIISNSSTSTGGESAQYKHPEFMVVRDLADFNQKLAQANQQGKTVMLDLYADWCVACKEFEKYTFPAPQVVEALSQAVWMQLDLSDNTPSNFEFQEEFGIVGLPTIMFFNQQGIELERARVTGFMKADDFAAHAENTLPKS
ncbi:MAG: thiol:disulfide interchange protein DsbD [Kangiellaceae bacterium]